VAFSAKGAGTTGTVFQQLLATMPSDSWQQLNASIGNGQPYNLLATLPDGHGGTGFTMCNYDGLPPRSCGGSGSGDYWTSDATVNGSADGAAGANPANRCGSSSASASLPD